MANVTAIFPWIHTSKAENGDIDAPVFLGIGGREFNLDSPKDDFELGKLFAEELSAHSTVNYPERNNPRSPYKLRTQDLDQFPVYLRVEGNDHWKVAMVLVMVGPGFNFYTADLNYDNADGGLWLGPTAGRILYLRPTSEDAVSKMLKDAKFTKIRGGIEAAKRAAVS